LPAGSADKPTFLTLEQLFFHFCQVEYGLDEGQAWQIMTILKSPIASRLRGPPKNPRGPLGGLRGLTAFDLQMT
jgi:hypothetical protein